MEIAEWGMCVLNFVTVTHIKIRAWWHVFVISAQVRQTQVNPQGSLAIQPSQIGQLQANEENLSQKTKWRAAKE